MQEPDGSIETTITLLEQIGSQADGAALVMRSFADLLQEPDKISPEFREELLAKGEAFAAAMTRACDRLNVASAELRRSGNAVWAYTRRPALPAGEQNGL